MAIKVLGLDVYSTILAGDDSHNDHPPRTGLEIILDRGEELGVIAVTCSDEGSYIVQADLGATFGKYPERRLSLKRFGGFYCLDSDEGKDYGIVAKAHNVDISEILVIHDLKINIKRAEELGCKSIKCPPYTTKGDLGWNFYQKT